jgi:PIN domain nuclease of toxin-antitoxin system
VVTTPTNRADGIYQTVGQRCEPLGDRDQELAGKLEAPEDLPALVEQLGFDLLPVTAEHAWRVKQLPFHHRDPFDRLLVAQAQLERVPIVTDDSAFGEYDVTVVWG